MRLGRCDETPASVRGVDSDRGNLPQLAPCISMQDLAGILIRRAWKQSIESGQPYALALG